MKNNKMELILSLKTNNILFDKGNENEICKQMENKVNVKNATIFYYAAHHFKIKNLSKISLPFIERCFPMVAESHNFLELSFLHIGKIILSSELNVDSELQIVNVVEDWLSHKRTKRSKYAKDLLLKIRLSLLSHPALDYILKSKSTFSMNAECESIIREALENKKESHSNKLSTTNRYCKQDKFSLLVCGGMYTNVVNDVFSIKAEDLNSVNHLAPMREDRKRFQAVCIKNEVYVFGGVDDNYDCIMSVEKYSPATNTWEKVADMYDDRKVFCACSFMDNVYVLGRLLNDLVNSCIKFIILRSYKCFRTTII